MLPFECFCVTGIFFWKCRHEFWTVFWYLVYLKYVRPLNAKRCVGAAHTVGSYLKCTRPSPTYSVWNTAQRLREEPWFLKSILCVWQFHVKYWKGSKLFTVFVYKPVQKLLCYCSKGSNVKKTTVSSFVGQLPRAYSGKTYWNKVNYIALWSPGTTTCRVWVWV